MIRPLLDTRVKAFQSIAKMNPIIHASPLLTTTQETHDNIFVDDIDKLYSINSPTERYPPTTIPICMQKKPIRNGEMNMISIELKGRESRLKLTINLPAATKRPFTYV